MRLFGMTALATGALLLGACGGGNNNNAADTSAAATTGAATTTATDSTAMAGGTAAATGAAAGTAAGTATAAPITGKTIEVKMIGDAKGYRFDPATITLKQGDGIKFVNVNGGPHNVAFDPASVPSAAQAQLNANMPNTQGLLNSPLLTQPNETYTVSFAKVAPGTYAFHCTPHLAMGMKGQVTVQ